MSLTHYLRTTCAIAGLTFCGLAVADTAPVSHYTASISADGKVQAQSPEWIDSIKYSAHPGYLANYEIKYEAGIYPQAPSFCAVSLTDTRSEDDLYYGQARLGAAPKATHVTVVTQLSKGGPSADSSQAFVLMCVK